ncbi:FMN-dependent NADH-azoreductase [Chryseobacterium paridis]|uniref:FMN dependent NADH:quinone oxidoreductase n=1 Tax=Chryseobacterium paridis TaxID=2800328 RepID=A0ABS1FUN3_9FLAO|nr:NAD(P)H-dependent oxidoreductase [Chryseobacterium paridis]MBK1896122.1 NAD(P)H-dependent oxidoreductase [Chryseobacterium paridis]
MITLLRIDSSLRMNDSYSRLMGDYFVQEWKIQHPQGKVIQRDVTLQLTPHLTQETLNGFFDETIHSEHLELSDLLIEELHTCDEILMTCPMYNYGIPSSLKAYFDQVVRTKKTFTNDSNGIKGLLLNKKASIISVMGMPQPLTQKRNPLEVQITNIFNQLGIMEISYFPMDGMINPEEAVLKMEQQKNFINQHFNHQEYATHTTSH